MRVTEKAARVGLLMLAGVGYNSAGYFISVCWNTPSWHEGLAGVVLAILAQRALARVIFNHQPLVDE